jgi:diaminopimelate epimerase
MHSGNHLVCFARIAMEMRPEKNAWAFPVKFLSLVCHLKKVETSSQITVKLPSMRFHENSFKNSGVLESCE